MRKDKNLRKGSALERERERERERELFFKQRPK